MAELSIENIQSVIDTLTFTAEEIKGNELLIQFYLYGLHFTFADALIEYDDEEAMLQFIVCLRQCPSIIQAKFIEQLPELTKYQKTLSTFPEKDISVL